MGVNPGKATNEPSNYFAFGKQTVKGTDATTFQFTKHLTGTGYDADIDIDSIREGGDGQEVGLRYKTMVKGDGSLIVNSRNAMAARLWDAVLGLDAIATGALASTARHTAAPVASLKYFTVEQRHADNIERQVDVVFTSLVMEGEAGKPFKYTAGFLTGGTLTYRDVASTLTAVRETCAPAYYMGGSYTFDAGASYANDVTKWRIEVNRGLDDGIQTTALNRDDLIPTNFDVNVDATIKYTSRAFYQKVIYAGGSAVPADLATGSLDLAQLAQVGTFAASLLARVVIPALHWTDAKVNKLDPDGKTVYLDLVGMSYRNATSAIYAQHDVNDIAAY